MYLPICSNVMEYYRRPSVKRPSLETKYSARIFFLRAQIYLSLPLLLKSGSTFWRTITFAIKLRKIGQELFWINLPTVLGIIYQTVSYFLTGFIASHFAFQASVHLKPNYVDPHKTNEKLYLLFYLPLLYRPHFSMRHHNSSQRADYSRQMYQVGRYR